MFDPVVLDLNGDGVHLTNLDGSHVYFDLNGDHFAEHTGWVSPQDGLLAFDHNGNGSIDDIGDLFGSGTQDGFAALAAYDSNSDGVISSADSVWSDLLVWRDANADGVSQASELTSLASAGVASIDLDATVSGDGVQGNVVSHRGTFTWSDGSTGQTAAVQFATDQVETHYQIPDSFQYDPQVFALPNLKGYGRVPDLWVAMSMDPTLKAMVQDLVAGASTLDSFGDVIGHVTEAILTQSGVPVFGYDSKAFEDMLHRWAQVVPAPAGQDDYDIPVILLNEPGSYGTMVWGGMESVNETIGAFLNRHIPTNSYMREEYYDAFQQFSTNIATRFYTQVPDLAGSSAFVALSQALAQHPPADGLSHTQAEADAILAPILQAYDERPAIGPAVSSLQGLHYDLATDSIVGDASVFIDTQLQDYDFDPDHPWQGYAGWYADHLYFLKAVDPDGATLDVRHRAYTDNLALSILTGPHNLIEGTSGNDTLTGDPSALVADLIVGGAGDDILHGGTGPDTYVFSTGSGADIVADTSGADEIAFQGALTADLAHFSFANGNRGDLLISFAGRAETVTVIGYFDADGNAGIEKITFPDGPVEPQREIRDEAIAGLATAGDDTIQGFLLGTTVIGLAGNDTLIGADGDDRLVGGTGNDVMTGGNNNDTYVFNAGDGNDIIRDGQPWLGGYGNDTVAFGASVAPADIVVSEADDGHDLVLTNIVTGDTITLDQDIDEDYSSYNRIEQVTFVDGTVWTHAQLMTMATAPTAGDDMFYSGYDAETLLGGAGNDTLIGREGDDHLNGGTGDDILIGGNDNDTYVFNVGDGHDIIRDGQPWLGGYGNDTVAFGAGIATADIAVSETDNGSDLILTNIVTGDTVTLDQDVDEDYHGNSRIERVLFSDGTIWNHAQLMTMATAPTAANDTFYGSYDGETLLGGAGNDTLIGREGNDVLNGGTGDDILIGGNDNDTYVFNAGDGHDVIRDGQPWLGGNGDDTVAFGAGIAAADIVVAQGDGGNDLVLTNSVTGDSITLDDDVSSANSRIEHVTFADGTSWTHAELMTMATTPTAGNDTFYGGYDGETLLGGAGNDTLIGLEGNDVLNGGTGDDILIGGDGDDTYVFNPGDGHDIIRDGQPWLGGNGDDTVAFGASVAAADIVVSEAHNGSDLVLTNIVTGDTVTLDQDVDDSHSRIEHVVFADGTSWDHAALLAMATAPTAGSDTFYGGYDGETLLGGAGNDTLIGLEGNDVLNGGTGDDLLIGGDGDDTYIFNVGDGSDVIADGRPWLGGYGNDAIHFGSGITPSDIVVTQDDDGNDLVLSDTVTGDSLRLDQDLAGAFSQIERVVFADGTVWTHADMVASIDPGEGSASGVISGTSGADTLYGTSGDDIFNAIGGNDVVRSGPGSDTFLYRSGDGSDLIDEESGSLTDIDVLKLLDLDPADVTFSRNGVDSTITVKSTGDVITLDEQFYNSDHWGIEQVVFADGTIWDRDDIQLASLIRGTSGGDTLFGTSGDDIFDAMGGNDVLRSGPGNDTFIYHSGDGSDLIDEESGSLTDVDVLKLVDLNPADVMLSRNGVDSTITVLATGQVITLDEQFYNSNHWGIEQISFADGTSWDRDTIQQASWYRGTSGNDNITGSDSSDTFDLGLGNDYVSSGLGSDTFFYASGDGNDEINENQAYSGDVDTLKLTDLNASDVTFSRDGVHDQITVNATGQTIAIDNQFYWDDRWGVEHVTFADGTSWDRADIQAASWYRGTSGNDNITGSDANDTFDLGLGNDTIHSGLGGDTFVYASGDGNDQIDENQAYSGDADTLIFTDLNASDVTFSRDGVDDQIMVNATGQTITIDNQFYWDDRWGIEHVTFADGTSWDRADIQAASWYRGTSGNDNITGSDASDTFDLGLGNDTIHSGLGSDTFVYASGDENDEIDENQAYCGDADTLIFTNLNASDVTFSRDGVHDQITVNATGQTITIDNQFYWDERWGIEHVTFADGTSWDRADIQAASWYRGTAGSDTVNASDGNDTLQGRAGDDVLDGHAGNDTYVYALGDGNDFIGHGGSSDSDVLQFGPGIAPQDLIFSQSPTDPSDIVVTFASASGSITLDNQASSGSWAIDAVHFANGTIWNAEDLQSHLPQI